MQLVLTADQIREADKFVNDEDVIHGDGSLFDADWDSLGQMLAIPPINPTGVKIDDFEWGAYVGGSPDQTLPSTHTYLALVARHIKTGKSQAFASVTGSRVKSWYASIDNLARLAVA